MEMGGERGKERKRGKGKLYASEGWLITLTVYDGGADIDRWKHCIIVGTDKY